MKSVPMPPRARALLAVLVLFGCRISEPVVLASDVWLDRTVLSPDDTVTVTVRVTNRSGGTLVLVRSSSCFLYFEVHCGSVVVVGPEYRVCTSDLIQEPLPSGEAVTESFRWNGTGFDGTRLASGTYDIRGWGRTVDGIVAEGPSEQIVLRSQ